MRTSFYLAVPIMMLLSITQSAIIARYPLLGFVPQLSFLVALSWGLLHDVEEGVTWAFVGGFFIDLFSVTPTGVTPFVWMIAILVVIQLSQIFPTSRYIMPTISGALGTLLYIAMQVLLLSLFGYQSSLETVIALLPLSILHGILILPVYWLMYTLLQRIRPRRVSF
ncbi:MAG: rod shape-determining protein MreD [Anaerolineales bacterium]|nr:rod shape-determining protein MreD [Anaerolineales bacterium]MCA9976807.1 rod shape-determining protein MreD [Anaerolineales bacterium]